jgi:Glyoxalase-like domain
MRIRQIVFAARQLQPAREALAALLQLPTPFRDPGVAEFHIDNAVFTFGDQFIEVISPTQPGTACGRHLDRHGDSGYMLILQTDDLARDRQRFAELGVRSVWSADFDDISAMHLHPKDVGAAIVSVDQPRPPASWRWGGPDWRVQPGAAGRQRVRGLRIAAHDPAALARRWAQVFGLAEPAALGDGWRLALTDGHADVVPAAGAAEGIAGFTLDVADPAAVVAAARAQGLPVDGQTIGWLGARLTIEALPTAAT